MSANTPNLSIDTESLTVIDGEARMHDLAIGEALGYTRPVAVRKLIRQHIKKLEAFGEVISDRKKPTGQRGGRPARKYHLNQDQTLFITAKSDTENAALITVEMVRVFGAHLRGEAAPAPEIRPVAAPDRMTPAEAKAAQARTVWDMDARRVAAPELDSATILYAAAVLAPVYRMIGAKHPTYANILMHGFAMGAMASLDDMGERAALIAMGFPDVGGLELRVTTPSASVPRLTGQAGGGCSDHERRAS